MQVLTVEKIDNQLAEIRSSIHRGVVPIAGFRFHDGDCPGAHDSDFDDSRWQPFRMGDSWGGYDRTAWFRATVPIPPELLHEKLALRFLVGPRDGGHSTAETLLYVNGFPLQAIDVWHEEAWLPPEVLADGEIVVALKAWSGVLGVPEKRRFKLAELVRIDRRAESFYYLADTVQKTVDQLDRRDWRHVKMLNALNESFALIDWSKPCSESFYCSLGEALDYLHRQMAAWQKLEPEKPTVVGVGHAHIDMAWLWRLSHSREKAARTFATALHLMRQYPEYRFMHSSPQLYKYLQEDYPEIFAQLREKISAGEWEITGGMWIEPDINLPSGESLIRQLLYGRRYIRETFGRDSKVVWLPDVFGYSSALPQILVKSGIRYFMTTKLSWSQFNRFSHDTFRWRGIDGSEILAHFITTPEEGSKAFTYNGQLEPKDVKGLWDNYQQKEVNTELLQAFGWGDGGGGPTKEMLEAARAMCNLPGLPKVELGHVEPFFERLDRRLEEKELPTWDGELYLEYHRGTYTSQARTKRDNRKAETLYHQAELFSAVADLNTGDDLYPDLTTGWELLLLNQFHDILPGSSIREVYEDSAKDFEAIREIGERALSDAESRLAKALEPKRDSVLVFNPLSFDRGGVVSLRWTPGLEGKTLADENGEPLVSQRARDEDGEKLLVHVAEIPPLGYRAFETVEAPPQEREPEREASREPNGEPSQAPLLTLSAREIDTPYYLVRLNERGQIASLLDKQANRQVLAAGERGNVLQAFEDKPLKFDAWDIDLYYQEKMREVDALVEAEVEEAGPLRGVLRLVWRFLDSTITQRLTVYANQPRIDFVTEVDWQESQILLKTAFPTSIRANRATFDIQFGNIERPTHWNTSWDWARFEVVGHKWADLSEGNYGVALLNDCKYGHDVKDHVMRLTLIKSPVRPDPQADKGLHQFTYSLLPHEGTWREGRVIQEGYDLNLPLQVLPVAGVGRVEREGELAAGSTPELPSQFSFARCDSDHVVIETVKRAEDGHGWIVRVYEAKQFRSAKVKLTFGKPLARAAECNLVEEGESPVSVHGHQLSFAITPYEIKTFRVWFG
ncbi:MAG: alpha-mannosidase [Trueperaceae bacterium]